MHVCKSLQSVPANPLFNECWTVDAAWVWLRVRGMKAYALVLCGRWCSNELVALVCVCVCVCVHVYVCVCMRRVGSCRRLFVCLFVWLFCGLSIVVVRVGRWCACHMLVDKEVLTIDPFTLFFSFSLFSPFFVCYDSVCMYACVCLIRCDHTNTYHHLWAMKVVWVVGG